MAGMFPNAGNPFGNPEDPLILFNPKTGWMACKAPMGYIPQNFPQFHSHPNQDESPSFHFTQMGGGMMPTFYPNLPHFQSSAHYQQNSIFENSNVANKGPSSKSTEDSDSDIISVSPAPASALPKERDCNLCADLGIMKKFLVPSEKSKDHVKLHAGQTGEERARVEELCFPGLNQKNSQHLKPTPGSSSKSTKHAGRNREERRNSNHPFTSPSGLRNNQTKSQEPPRTVSKKNRVSKTTLRVPEPAAPENSPVGAQSGNEVPIERLPDDLDRMLLRFTEKCLRKRRHCLIKACTYSSPLTVKSKLYQSLNTHILSHFGDHLLFCTKCKRKLEFGKGTHHRKFHPKIIAKDFYLDVRAEHEAELIRQFKECFEVNKDDSPLRTHQTANKTSKILIKTEESGHPALNGNCNDSEQNEPIKHKGISLVATETIQAENLNFTEIFVAPADPPSKSDDGHQHSSGISTKAIESSQKAGRCKRKRSIKSVNESSNVEDKPIENSSKIKKQNLQGHQPEPSTPVIIPPPPSPPQNFLDEMKKIEREYAAQNLQCMIPNCYLAVRNKSLKVLLPHLYRHFDLLLFDCAKCTEKDGQGGLQHKGQDCNYRDFFGGFEKDLISLARKCFPPPDYLRKR